MLFTIPDSVANTLQQLVPAGDRSKFVVRYIEIPLKELKKTKKKSKKAVSIYKPKFLRDLKKAEEQAEKGHVYSEEYVMKEFGLL